MPPIWLQSFAAIYVPLSIAGALAVLTDIFLLGCRQKMRIMEAVWPLTILYWGPLGLIFYASFGRPVSGHGDAVPMWQSTFKGATHCGAGCALGDLIGDWIAFQTGLTLVGSLLAGDFALAFLLAYLFGIVFQYFAIAPMRHLGLREGLIAAAKIDTLSLLAYQLGMVAWMGMRAWLYPVLEPTTWSYWLMMQVAMVFGFLTTYPVNWFLIARGVKERM